MVNPDQWNTCLNTLRLLKPICENMEDKEITRLMEAGELISFRASSVISYPGRPAPAVYIILRGSVLVSRSPTWGGDHRIYIARRRAGTFVGEVTGRKLVQDKLDPSADTNFAFTGQTRAETDCEMLQLKHEVFADLVESGGKFSLNVVRCMTIKVLEASNRMEFLKHRSAISRIADELLHLWEQQNHPDKIEIPMQMKDFAWWLDLEPPTLSRGLKDMEREGLIEYHSPRQTENKRKGTVTIKDSQRLYFLRQSDDSHCTTPKRHSS